jgi:hypothetical protein
MMKITRTYFTGCTWCNATGFVYTNNFGMGTTALTKPCPVCIGSKTIIVTEIFDDNYILPHDKPVESLENPK